jgi:serine/threonine protein kinase
MVGQPPSEMYETGKLPPGVILGGRYLLLRKVAQGGMGAVYEAKEVPTSTILRLAVKEMSLSILSMISQEQRQVLVDSFHREFDLLSKLEHPNLVRAYQFFEEQSRYYFVMEYIEGRTLETILDTLPPGQFLEVDRVLAWARQLCEVLQFLHSQRPPIIYRDLKPSNVMELNSRLAVSKNLPGISQEASSADGDAGTGLDVKIKLFDFGIARFYKPGQKSDTVRFGTEGYLAPEIIAYHTQTSERTDVYALGSLLHQVFTRYDPQMDPWKRPSVRSVNPQVPEQVARAIEHALALNPANRTPSAQAFLDELFRGLPAQFKAPVSQATPVSQPARPARAASQPAVESATAEPRLHEMQDASKASAANVQSAASSTTLNLGEVQKGRVATGSFEVVLSPMGRGAAAMQGQVKSLAPWLKVEPDRFSADTNVTVRVNALTRKLPLGHWEASAAGRNTTPLWFLRLPGFMRAWLAFHLDQLAPRPFRYQGIVLVSFGEPGGQSPSVERSENMNLQVQVLLEVFPPTWRSFLGWVLAFGLIGLELIVLLGLMMLALGFLLSFIL